MGIFAPAVPTDLDNEDKPKVLIEANKNIAQVSVGTEPRNDFILPPCTQQSWARSTIGRKCVFMCVCLCVDMGCSVLE